jgi:hypothetical protein
MTARFYRLIMRHVNEQNKQPIASRWRDVTGRRLLDADTQHKLHRHCGSRDYHSGAHEDLVFRDVMTYDSGEFAAPIFMVWAVFGLFTSRHPTMLQHSSTQLINGEHVANIKLWLEQPKLWIKNNNDISRWRMNVYRTLVEWHRHKKNRRIRGETPCRIALFSITNSTNTFLDWNPVKVSLFWDLTPLSLERNDRRFGKA